MRIRSGRTGPWEPSYGVGRSSPARGSSSPSPGGDARPERRTAAVHARDMIVRTLLGTALTALVLTGPAPPAAATGAWRWPLPSPVAVVRPFEEPTGPYGPGHRGVDLASLEGALVRAAGAGTVLVAGR